MDRGLGAAWLSHSSSNLHCPLLRFQRQSGSISQTADGTTAGRRDQWSFQFVMGLDTSTKAKTIAAFPTRHWSQLAPMTSLSSTRTDT